MGYRSTVYIKFNKEYAAEFKFLLGIHEVTWLELQEDEGDKYTRYIGTYLKWYDSYKDVAPFNTFVEERQDAGIIAIGEDGATAEYGDPYETGMSTWTETVIEDF
jgi:hypothetical protein